MDLINRRVSTRMQLTRIGVELVGAKLRLGLEGSDDCERELAQLENTRDRLEAQLIAAEERFWAVQAPYRRFDEMATLCDELRSDRTQWARRARDTARAHAQAFDRELSQANQLGNQDRAARAVAVKSRLETIASSEERTLADLGSR